MNDSIQEPKFRKLLSGPQAWTWNGILLSAGGNDLIDAVQVMPRYGDDHPLSGQLIPPDQRILLRPDEWKPGATADRYISDAGWLTFSNHLSFLFAQLQALRDGAKSKNRDVPVFVHCYDFLQARNAPAGPGMGPWLFPAVQAYGIPPGDWPALGVLINRLKALLQGIPMSHLHVVDTTGTLIPADPGDTGKSNDWQNEIHPTKGGYKKLAKKYAAEIDKLLP